MVTVNGRDADRIYVNGRQATRVYANGRIAWPAQVDYANKLEEALGNGGLFGVRVTPVIASNQLRWQGNTGQGVTETQTPAGSATQQQINRIRAGGSAVLDLHRFTYGQEWSVYIRTLTDHHTWYVWSENAEQYYSIRANRSAIGRIGGGFCNYSVFHDSAIWLGFNDEGSWAGFMEGAPADQSARILMVPSQNLIARSGTFEGGDMIDREAFRQAILGLSTNPDWAPHTMGVALLDNNDWRPY